MLHPATVRSGVIAPSSITEQLIPNKSTSTIAIEIIIFSFVERVGGGASIMVGPLPGILLDCPASATLLTLLINHVSCEVSM
jgi:hypothetical protein